jgi:nicotinate phosphoribosyltransferase
LFAGLEECLKFVQNYKFHATDIDYLRTTLPDYVETEFYNYLAALDINDVKIYAVPEGKNSFWNVKLFFHSVSLSFISHLGSVVFPRIPLLRIEGPILKAQLLETTLLTLVNFASLIATNAARFRATAGPNKILDEFGLRRAQGPDGGLTASKYCYIGGFNGTSNVLAGKLYGIPTKGKCP